MCLGLANQDTQGLQWLERCREAAVQGPAVLGCKGGQVWLDGEGSKQGRAVA